MKHIPTHLLPAIALLALGGCATTGGLTTTEPDGVYYSSKDRTSAVAPVASADQSTDYAATDDPNAVTNPDYQDGRSKSRGTASDEYYDEDFDYNYYARNRRYNGLGMGYNLSYADPYWYRPTFAYNDPFFYSPYGYGYSYSPWYDPFWGPNWYGGGVSISIGWGLGGWGPWGPYGGYYGRPWGYGGYGYGWGGYNRGFYDGYYSGLYGGGYGGYWDGYRGGNRAVNYRVGHRNNRSVEVVGASNGGGRSRVSEATGGRMATDNGAVASPDRYRRGRIAEGSAVQPQPGQVMADQPVKEPGRGRLYRIQETEATPGVSYPAGTVKPQGNGEMAEQPTRYQRGRFSEAAQPSQARSQLKTPARNTSRSRNVASGTPSMAISNSSKPSRRAGSGCMSRRPRRAPTSSPAVRPTAAATVAAAAGGAAAAAVVAVGAAYAKPYTYPNFWRSYAAFPSL